MLHPPEPTPLRQLKIAIMGAAASGKTQLIDALQQAFANELSDEEAMLIAPACDPWDAVLPAHRDCDLTLICGLDQAPEQNANPAHEAWDATLRTWLQHNGLPYAVVYGQDSERLASARRCIAALKNTRKKSDRKDQPPWHWRCDHCSDPGCEHRLFTGRLNIAPG